MRNLYRPFCGLLALSLLFLSCGGGPKNLSPGREPSYPATPEALMGTGAIPAKDMRDFLLGHNAAVEPAFVEELVGYYIEESGFEGINYEVAFAQMCLETGYLRFGGLVIPEMNNFCGLGALGPEQPGEYFESPKIGVRAHVQHLKAYATPTPLNRDLVDPRYRYVRKGAAPVIDGLAGTWAADGGYSGKIRAILERLYAFSYGKQR